LPPETIAPNNTNRTGEADEQNPSDDRQEPPDNLEATYRFGSFLVASSWWLLLGGFFLGDPKWLLFTELLN
jgi:hypothetical protein